MSPLFPKLSMPSASQSAATASPTNFKEDLLVSKVIIDHILRRDRGWDPRSKGGRMATGGGRRRREAGFSRWGEPGEIGIFFLKIAEYFAIDAQRGRNHNRKGGKREVLSPCPP